MSSRQPLQLVEIDIDFCGLEYGVGSCPAVLGVDSDQPCWNTFSTCPTNRTRAAFSNTDKTLRFSKNQTTGIYGQIVWPALQSVSTNPTEITLGAVDERLGSLGKRERVTVAFRDFKWGDQITDPYVDQRAYDTSQGTFFGKLRARFPYYYGRSLRVKNGYVGDDPDDMQTLHYIITEWQGPDADGNVKITAQDPLKLADEDLSQCPKPSNGRLGADIGETGGVFTLVPAGIGAEYGTSGRASIGSEIVSFARSVDTITLTGRGLDGTEASSHSIDDTFQEAFFVEDAKVYSVAATLLSQYADVDFTFIPYADWVNELDTWLGSVLLTRTIPKPVGVATLLGEIAQLGIIFWWDKVAQEIKLKANRPVGLDETITPITDESNILEKTITSEDLHDQRVSQVWFYHGVLDYSGSTTNSENYRNLYVAADLQAESENEYDQTRIKEIYQPWLGNEGVRSTASAVAQRLKNRYRDTPQRITFHADIKDRDALAVAELIEAKTRVVQDVTGASAPKQMQVTKTKEIDPGHIVEVTAETYQFRGRFGFITENGRPDYSASTVAQKAKGTYIVDEATLEFGDGTGPYVIF